MKPPRRRRPLEPRARRGAAASPPPAPATHWKVAPLADGSWGHGLWGLSHAGHLLCYGDAERMAAIAERLRAADQEREEPQP